MLAQKNSSNYKQFDYHSRAFRWTIKNLQKGSERQREWEKEGEGGKSERIHQESFNLSNILSLLSLSLSLSPLPPPLPPPFLHPPSLQREDEIDP